MTLNYCNNCGKKITFGEKYCSNCGQKLMGKDKYLLSIVSTVIKGVITKVPVKSLGSILNKKVLSRIGIGILILVAFNMINKSPTDVAEDFINYTAKEDYESARELWSQEGIDYLLSNFDGDEQYIQHEMFIFTHRVDYEGGGGNLELDDFKITKEEKTGPDVSLVYAEFIFDNGWRDEAQLNMVKEDGKWKVYAFQTY